MPQTPIWFAVFGQRRTARGGPMNNSSRPTPRGFAARGFSAISTINGIRVVRAQYEIL